MNLNLTTATRYGLNVLVLFAAALALHFGQAVFVPFTMAGLLAAVLWPAARYFHTRWRLPWFVACAVVIALMVLVVLLLLALVAVSIPQLLDGLPRADDEQGMKTLYEQLRGKIAVAARPMSVDEVLKPNPDESGAYSWMRRLLSGELVTTKLWEVGERGLGMVAETTLVLFILLFLLLEGQMLVNKGRRLFGTGPAAEGQVSAALKLMAESVRSYLVWRTIVNAGLGLVCGAVYWAVGMKHYVLWGLITFIFCYVPYLGTIAAGVFPVLDALLYVGPWAAFGVLAFYVVAVTVEGYILVPWVMGRSMDLNATTVLLACLFWYLVWGTAGLFLAMPLMAAIRAVCLQVPELRPWGMLMSSEDVPLAPDTPDGPPHTPTAAVPDPPAA